MSHPRRASLRASLHVTLGTALLAAWPGLSAAQIPPTSPAAVEVLVRQAERWLAQDRVDLATPVVERAVAAAPDSASVLSVAARLEVARGNRDAANAFLARLRAVGATPEQRSQAESAVRSATIDRNAIGEAQRLAREGRAEAAVQRYRQAFGADGPTDAFAQEYYQTLSGTEAGRAEGQRGLAALAARPGATDRTRLAYAQSLTYSASTRDEGIRRLAELADRPEVAQEARQSWRAALGFFGNSPAAAPGIEAYLLRFQDDAELRRRLEVLRAAPPPAPADPNAPARQAAFARTRFRRPGGGRARLRGRSRRQPWRRRRAGRPWRRAPAPGQPGGGSPPPGTRGRGRSVPGAAMAAGTRCRLLLHRSRRGGGAPSPQRPRGCRRGRPACRAAGGG